jgi:hypothetical protein
MAAETYKVVERFKGSKTYISMGGMSMREIDLDLASQEDLKAIYDQGATEVVEKVASTKAAKE